MTSLFAKVKLFFKNTWNAALGIYAEILLICVFVAVGFIVCIFWWGITR